LYLSQLMGRESLALRLVRLVRLVRRRLSSLSFVRVTLLHVPSVQ
jgi:hypothetical protein